MGIANKYRRREKALEKDPFIKAVTMVHNETSTGVRNPVAELGKIVRNTKALW